MYSLLIVVINNSFHFAYYFRSAPPTTHRRNLSFVDETTEDQRLNLAEAETEPTSRGCA